MEFVWPLALLGLTVVGAVAALAFFRPSREMLVVGSLALWKRAVDSLAPSLRRRSRRVMASWVLLLVGAAAAVLAAARPVYRRTLPGRRIGIAVYPSAELAGQRGGSELRGAISALLDRLGGPDRIQLILPAVMGGASDWLGPKIARGRVDEISPLPAHLEELDLPAPSSRCQHVYKFAPVGAGLAAGPNVSVVELPADTPPVTIDAFGGAVLPDGKVQIFAAVRNHSSQPWSGRVEIFPLAREGAEAASYVSGPIVADGGGRGEIVAVVDPAAALGARLVDARGTAAGLGGTAFLVAREASVRNVAMLGGDLPYVRRFVRVDRTLQLVADGDEADLVIANRADPPADKPAMVINPQEPPPGWRRGRELSAIVLVDADVAADDPIMRDCDLAGVAIRRVTPWVAAAGGGYRPLASYKGEGLILRNRPGVLLGPTRPPRRVYVAFDMAAENTNFPMTDAFVVFMANVTRWLGPPRRVLAGFEYVTPLQAGPQPQWRPVELAGFEDSREGGLLPAPGIYADPAGRLHAVSLVALGGGRMPPVEPLRAVADVPLPAAQRGEADVEFAPGLIAAAMALWLAGWALRASRRGIMAEQKDV